MKNILTFLLITVFATTAIPQNGDKWEAWAESLAAKAERIAERTAENAERNAEAVAAAAEELAADIEERFDRANFQINLNGRSGKFYNLQSHDTGYLGIHSDHISKTKAEKLGFKNAYGSYITRVVKNSAADKAGLRAFDYIYGVEDQRTSNNQDLSDILADYEPGEEVTIHFIRKGQKKSVKVELGDYDDFDWDYDANDDAFLGVRPNSDERRNDMDGVHINVVKGTSAENIGLENGDIIKAINGNPILDWDDVSTAINNLRPGENITVTVERDGSEIEKSGQLGKNERGEHHISLGDNGNRWDWGDDEEKWEQDNRAFLGIYTDKISEKKARALGFDNPYGSYVSGVIKGTAAEKAGLMPFDYVYGIDEYRAGEEQHLGGILRKYEAGDEATVHFYRKSKKMNKPVVFRAKMHLEKEHKNKCEDPFFGIVELDKDDRQHGVRVKPVRNSSAEDLGLEEGDVITHINGYQMYDWHDIGMAIDMLSPGDKIQVNYMRGGEKRSGSHKILSYAETKNCKDCDCGDKHGFSIVTPDIEIKFRDRYRDRDDYNEPRIEVDDLDVDLSDVSNSEARALESKGIDMAISNDLAVDNLRLASKPNIGMFELQFDLETEGETAVKVFNQSGRAIYEYELGRFSGDFSDYIDISQNGPGTYFLQVVQDEKSFVRKVVLTKD